MAIASHAQTFPISRLPFIVKATQLSDDLSLAKPMLPASHWLTANLSLMVSLLLLANPWLQWLSTELEAFCQLVVSSSHSIKTTHDIFEYPPVFPFFVSKISFSNLNWQKYHLWQFSLVPYFTNFDCSLCPWVFLTFVCPSASFAHTPNTSSPNDPTTVWKLTSELVNPTVTISTPPIPHTFTHPHSKLFLASQCSKTTNSLPEPFFKQDVCMCVCVCVCVCVCLCVHVYERCSTLMWENNGPSLNGLYSGATQPVPAWSDNEPAITSFFHFYSFS